MGASLRCREMFSRMPMAARHDTRFDPPELTNGRALPANGSSPTITIMLMLASRPIQITSPAAISVPSMSGARLAISMPRHTIPA